MRRITCAIVLGLVVPSWALSVREPEDPMSPEVWNEDEEDVELKTIETSTPLWKGKLLQDIAWVHFPKTGTSFANTLFHHAAICPGMPTDESAYLRPDPVPQDTCGHYSFTSQQECETKKELIPVNCVWESGHCIRDPAAPKPESLTDLVKLLKTYPVDKYCPGAFSQSYHSPPLHCGIGDVYARNKDHLMAFFRKPEKRLISGYQMAQHSWPRTMGHKPTKNGQGFLASNVVEYSKQVNGCYVRMLTRGKNPHISRRQSPAGSCNQTCGMGSLPTHQEVQTAVRRVDEMAFVGLSEEWDLSICLFHAKFGGECNDNDFINTRPHIDSRSTNPSIAHAQAKKDTKILEEQMERAKFVDRYDGPVYERAVQRFWKDMKALNLDRAKCEKVCAKATKTRPFALKDSTEKERHTKTEDFRYDWPGRPEYDIDF